jgi:CHAT domain-containing protein
VRLADTWLTVHDVYNLDLNADLVTLSACDTGVSQVAPGDELLGLARGFFYAGATSLLVSLWAVNDLSTATLMERFYHRLQAGYPKAAALRLSILDVKRDSPHPYHWAPFILMGNGG